MAQKDTSPATQVLDLRAFSDYLARELDLDRSYLHPETRFVEDLGFDSLRMLELVVVVEELGMEFDDSELDSLESLGTVHSIYVKAFTP